jgi:drug/metabolite transporter (DMT)-like permease
MTQTRRVDKAQYGLAAALAVVGVWTIVDARGLNVGYADPIGPRVYPYVIGGVMVVLAAVLAWPRPAVTGPRLRRARTSTSPPRRTG